MTTKFIATTLNGTQVTRSSKTLAYTHAVVGQSNAISWHTRRDLALKASREHNGWPGRPDVHVVPVTRVEVAKVKTSARDINATKRGVLTRAIRSLEESLARYEAQLVTWDGGRSEAEKTRLIRDFGEERGLAIHQKRDAEHHSNIAWARNAIATKIQERDALVAQAKTEEA